MNRRTFLKNSVIAGATVGLGFQYSCNISVKNRFETIIANGLIYAGDGKAPIKADIGISDGKIVAIGKLGNSCDKYIDAANMAVSPGFIDIHTHTDTKFHSCPFGDSRIYQGITTDIGGNCGSSPSPGADGGSIKDFYSKLEELKIGINYKSFTGQGTLRNVVAGANNVEATPEQIVRMKSLLSDEMEAGSLGLSSGLEYTPGSFASKSEITELCKVVAKYNGLFAIHLRNEDDRVEEALQEAIDIAKDSGVRLQIAHLKAQNAANWHKAPDLLKMIEKAESEGIDIAFDRYPYIAFSTGLSNFIPLDLRQGTTNEIVERLKNDKIAKKIGEHATPRFTKLGGLQNIVITSGRNENNAQYIGKNLLECSEISGLEPWAFVRQLLIEENNSVSMVVFAMTEDNVKLFLSHRLGMPASDGSLFSPVGPLSQSMPHPRSYGTFPRFIGKYCRDEKLMDLSDAIHKCTGLPASRLNLKNRGLLIPNYYADIVIFNPDTIIDTATYSEPHQFPKGIEHVFVNGQHAIESGEGKNVFSGKIL